MFRFCSRMNESERCRLCTANDKEAIVEQLAERLFTNHRAHASPVPWESAGIYWHFAFRDLARSVLEMLEHRQ